MKTTILPELAPMVEATLSSIDAAATKIPIERPDAISASDENVLEGSFDDDLDGTGRLTINYDENSTPIAYRMDLEVKGNRGYLTPVIHVLSFIDGEVVLEGNPPFNDEKVVLYRRGEGFAEGIGPVRAQRALGYLSVLQEAVESRTEQ